MVLFTRKNSYNNGLSRLNQVIDYIHNNYANALNLEKLANIACLSRYHFHRQFHMVMDETPNDFIQRLRLEKATHQLMLEQYKPISEIAYECGFSTSQNFSRAYKAKYGVTPTVTREELNWDNLTQKLRQLRNGQREIGDDTFVFIEQFLENRGLTLEEMLAQYTPIDVTIKTFPPCRVAYVRTIGQAYSLKAIRPALTKLVLWAFPRGYITTKTLIRGVAWNNTDLTPNNRLIYDLCIEVPENVKPNKHVSIQTLSGGDYAVYRGVATVKEHEEQLELVKLLRWLLFSSYRPDCRPYFNIYLNSPHLHPKKHAIIDLCMPVMPVRD